MLKLKSPYYKEIENSAQNIPPTLIKLVTSYLPSFNHLLEKTEPHPIRYITDPVEKYAEEHGIVLPNTPTPFEVDYEQYYKTMIPLLAEINDAV